MPKPAFGSSVHAVLGWTYRICHVHYFPTSEKEDLLENLRVFGVVGGWFHVL